MNHLLPVRTFPKILLILLSLVVIGLAVWAAAGLLFPPPVLEVTFIDVGQGANVGDAILLRSSEGKVVLIDGGYPNTGALAYLQSQNVTHIDTVILSHAHDDHSGGLVDVFKNIKVDQFIYNGQELDTPVFTNLMSAVKAAGVPIRVVKKGDTIAFGKLTFKVIHPRKINKDTVNNNSIVMRLEDGSVSFLFTGDLMKLQEQLLVDTLQPIQVDILKIPHHGANTSSSAAFIEKVHPALAIYSSGIGNMHHLPQPETFETLKTYGDPPVYGTDVNGTIIVRTDGRTYTVEMERGDPR